MIIYFLERIRKFFKSIGKKEEVIDNLITYRKFKKNIKNYQLFEKDFYPEKEVEKPFKIAATITFYYDKNVNLKEYHKNTNYYLKPHRDYLINQYDPKYVIKNNLVIIKSVRDILERNNIKKYTFYKPLKQRWWEEKSNNKCEWFDTGDHYDDIKNHNLGYLVKKDFWKNQRWAKAVFYD